MKIIVAHPGRQHSFRLASALKKNNMLLYYVTTVYDKDTSLLMKLAKKFLSRDNLKRANGRKNKDLSDTDVIQYYELGGFIEILLYRLKHPNPYIWYQHFNADRFGKKVAKLAIKNKADALICYDTNSGEAFKYLKEKAPDIVRIQDVSIAARPYVKKLFAEEVKKTGHSELFGSGYAWNTKNMDRMQQEIYNTQFFLSASNYVKNTLIQCGANENNIKVVPYGANVSSDFLKEEILEGKRIEFLFVGSVSYRKGITYILESIASFSKEKAHLTIVGNYNETDWFVKKYKNNLRVTFIGYVTQDKLQKIYEDADVFVIDSFSEGMAQVGIEAMACGLPIICSDHSGVNDLVENGKNGFVIPCGDLNALKEKMQWFIDNPDRIREMGKSAHQVGKRYTWAYYEQNVVQAIKNIVQEKKRV